MSTLRGAGLALGAMLIAHGLSHAATRDGGAHEEVAAETQPQTMLPERQVAGNMITSARDPKVRIELPASVRYVGADRWVLYGIADCELHAFVEVDENNVVQRRYWVQFEDYLPSRPELSHRYDSPQHTTIGGLDFYVDTWVVPGDATDRPGSDSEHIRALILAKGYKLPAAIMSVRLVHLLDERKRKELMIIYSENAAPTGFSAADLSEGGKAHEQWPLLAQALLSRAKGRVSLQQN
jgi:hypothetical protein